MMRNLALTFLVLAGLGVTWAKCPPKKSGSLCHCSEGIFYEGEGTKVNCRSVNDPQLLKNEIQRFQGYHIDFLKFTQVQLPYLPPGLFSGTSVKQIHIVDSQLDNLYNIKEATPSPFEGLDESLEEIYVQSTRDPSKWYWPEVKHLKKLKKFIIVQSPIDFIGHIFAEIGGGSLESITATYSKVNRIHPQAFPELTNLQEVNFAGNYLPYLVRTMFPNPAPRLQKINFRDNKLFLLPEDMFENMPDLKYLDLSQNEFKNFQNIVFDPLLNRLDVFFIADNPFKCGCSLRSLKKNLISGFGPETKDFEEVTCFNHGDNKKTKLRELDISSLPCKQLKINE